MSEEQPVDCTDADASEGTKNEQIIPGYHKFEDLIKVEILAFLGYVKERYLKIRISLRD